MTDKAETRAPIRARDIQHGWTFGGNVVMKYRKFEIAAGNKKVKGRDGKHFVVEQNIELEGDSPVGYDIDYLRLRLNRLSRPVVTGAQKKVEFHIDRFPQVATVMGEINARMPKGQKLQCGWTTNDETNTLFVIERAKRK